MDRALTLLSLVTADRPDVTALLERLFTDTLAITGPWSEAADLVVRHPRLTVVTKAGDRLGPSGWRLAGDRTGATGAAQAEAEANARAAQFDQTEAERAVDDAEGRLLAGRGTAATRRDRHAGARAQHRIGRGGRGADHGRTR